MRDWVTHPENPTEVTLSQRLQRHVGLVWGVIVEPGAVARTELPGLVSAVEAIGWAVWGKPSIDPELEPDRFAARLIVGVQIAAAGLWDRTQLADATINNAIARFAATDRAALLGARPWLEPALAAEPRAWMVAHNWAEVLIGNRICHDELSWICVPEPLRSSATSNATAKREDALKSPARRWGAACDRGRARVDPSD